MNETDLKSLLRQYEELRRFEEKINNEKILFEKYPHIKNGKLISDNMNINLIPKFKDEDKYNFNLEIKYLNLISGLSITNENILNSFQLWDKIHNNDIETIFYNSYNFIKLYKLNEYIISDIKKFIDESISTIWCIKQKKYINKITIDSIGKLKTDLKESHPQLSELKEFEGYFDIINDICNSNKHSFTNNLEYIIGRDDNCVTAIYSKKNYNINKPKLYVVKLEDIINEFNYFYEKFFNIVEQLSSKS